MIYKEIKKDLFEAIDDNKEAYACYTISADFKLEDNTGREFNFKYDMRNKLNTLYSDKIGKYPNCLLVGQVFNLVTKDKYYNKPTYDTLTRALVDMKHQCEAIGVKKLCMPLIGCGLDKLEWDAVRIIIKNLFELTDINILVCKK